MKSSKVSDPPDRPCNPTEATQPVGHVIKIAKEPFGSQGSFCIYTVRFSLTEVDNKWMCAVLVVA